MDLNVSAGWAFLAGLLSFLSPCVLPLVPPYLCFLAGVSFDELSQESESARSRIVTTALAFVLGFTTVFVALGATASVIGQTLTRYLDSFAIVAGAIVVIMGLHFLGLLRLNWLYAEKRVHVTRKPPGILGGYLVGLAFAFGWTPCVGPVLAAILFMAGAEETVWQGAGLLLIYALGIGLPFLLAALFAGAFLRLLARMKAYMGAVEKTMGAMLVVTGILIMTGQMSRMAYWLLELFPSLGTIG